MKKFGWRSGHFHDRNWTPAEVTTAAWYDAADKSTIKRNNNLVSQWNDKSGNDYHATQASASNQFTYTTDSQFRPAMYLGSAKYMNANNLTTLLSDYNCECYVVINLDSFSSKQIFEFGGGVNTSSFQFRCNSSRLESYQQAIITDIAYQSSAVLPSPVVDDPDFGAAVQSGSPHLIKWAGGLTANGFTGDEVLPVPIPGPNGSFTTFELGRVFGTLDFYFYELIFFASPRNIDTRRKVEGYLAWKWQIQDKLADNHPYKTAPPQL
jgi:hypothetical protein